MELCVTCSTFAEDFSLYYVDCVSHPVRPGAHALQRVSALF